MSSDHRPWAKAGTRRNHSRIVRAVRLLRTRRPVSFNEKVRYKLLRDHSDLMVTFADKAAMRHYVSSVVGAEYLPRLLLISSNPDDVIAADLPGRCVLKPTHGSGACIVIDEDAPAINRLPEPRYGWVYAHVRPEYADPDQLRAIATHWLDSLYGRGPNHEWAYGRAKRNVLVEELLRSESGGIPHDMKLFVFHGRCEYIQVDGGRFGQRTQDFYDRAWRRLDLSGGHPGAHPSRPARLAEMLSLAERLGAQTDFVRVDLYCLDDRIVVGELTSSPAGGDSPFIPSRWNAVFGSHWTVPHRYK